MPSRNVIPHLTFRKEELPVTKGIKIVTLLLLKLLIRHHHVYLHVLNHHILPHLNLFLESVIEKPDLHSKSAFQCNNFAHLIS